MESLIFSTQERAGAVREFRYNLTSYVYTGKVSSYKCYTSLAMDTKMSYIIYMHRKHDIRVSLCSVEKTSADDPSVLHFVTSAINMPEPGIIHYNPLASDEKWYLTYIRHQEWESYKFHDSYTVDLSSIGEFYIDPKDLNCHEIRPKDFRRHHEVEVP